MGHMTKMPARPWVLGSLLMPHAKLDLSAIAVLFARFQPKKNGTLDTMSSMSWRQTVDAVMYSELSL